MGDATHGELDFESFSSSGFCWDEQAQKWRPPKGAKDKGLGVVGVTVYTEDPSFEILTASYRLPLWWHERVGTRPGKRRWRPGQPNPQELFDYLAAGGVLECHNAFFELSSWENGCTRKYGWPSLLPHRYQLRCSMAKARVNSLPGGLADLSNVLALAMPKDAEGKRLLKKFSIPRDPTKTDPRLRVLPPHGPPVPPPPTAPTVARKAYEAAVGDWADFQALEGYCDRDIDAEAEASAKMRPMSADELTFWWVDQEINWRGIAIDRGFVRDAIAVLEQALAQYGDEFRALTGLDPTQLQAARGWLAARGVYTDSLDEEHRVDLLKRLVPHPPEGVNPARRAVEIIDLIGSASVKKLYAMDLQAGRDDRLKNLIVHHGTRTGRPTGEGPQPLNLPKAGPALLWCECKRPFKTNAPCCPWCGATPPRKADGKLDVKPWLPDAIEHVREIFRHRSLALVETFFGDALLTISGSVRGMFIAREGCDLIASDYSAIEAVVTAMIAGEGWRIEAFRNKEDIYLVGAAKITGMTVEAYKQYKADNGSHHPDRQYIGKVSELALGFGGWINAWLAFDESGRFTDDQIKRNILAWRDASPTIVELWGGQFRAVQGPWGREVRTELYGFEGAAINAISYPGHVFDHKGFKFQLRDHVPDETRAVWKDDPQENYFLYGDPAPRWDSDIIKRGKPGDLIITLLSGRELTYRDAHVTPSTRPGAKVGEKSIVYWTDNKNPKYGPRGWVPMNTFGGRLTENIVQATAHDILRYAILALRAAGYPTVLHIYDEIVAEIPIGTGSIEEFERIMSTMPPWAAGWPIRAAGGWRGKRYRKD